MLFIRTCMGQPKITIYFLVVGLNVSIFDVTYLFNYNILLRFGILVLRITFNEEICSLIIMGS